MLLTVEPTSQFSPVLIEVDHDLVSNEALLKVCYWFSRDFTCDIKPSGSAASLVTLTPKASCQLNAEETREFFATSALDFELRERITATTSSVRDLLLAKAFSESGVLEDEPEGIFGDRIEEAKPDGMFKILSNS